MIVFVAGEGGHLEQFKRLYHLLGSSIDGMDKVLISDYKRSIDIEIETKYVGALVHKSGFKISIALKYLVSLFTTVQILINKKDLTLISLGPGIAFPFAVFTKLFGGKVVHIETWSRFHSKSLTARMMYGISDVFYVQNREMLDVFPKAIFSGRL